MMESTSSRISVSNPSRQCSKRLLFDRRYGWVIDEWKDPSEEALDGGRGMFCILPLARALVQKASETINHSATLAIKAFEKPQLFSHQTLQAAFDDGLRNITSSLKNTGSKCNILGKNSHSHASSNYSSKSQLESNE